ncbi:MAG: hypothetical protein JXB10_10155 [Pirellulales bacterium]|nr:hypothetical protein [Pirellulales bacterium]
MNVLQRIVYQTGTLFAMKANINPYTPPASDPEKLPKRLTRWRIIITSILGALGCLYCFGAGGVFIIGLWCVVREQAFPLENLFGLAVSSAGGMVWILAAAFWWKGRWWFALLFTIVGALLIVIAEVLCPG